MITVLGTLAVANGIDPGGDTTTDTFAAGSESANGGGVSR
jgi:hypothetical protein